ncbi:MAG: TIGR03067 domain-containing protein [Planctomycetota bacterium]
MAAADDQAISTGAWEVVAVEWDGTPVDPEWLARLRVAYEADGAWIVFLKRLPVAAGTSRIRQDTNPKSFEMQTLGSEGIKPSRFHGIYRLDGDTRLLCIVREGTPLPDTFAAPRHSNRMLVTMSRVRESRAEGYRRNPL